MAKSEVDYRLKCNYSDIIFEEWNWVESSKGRIKRNGEIVQSGLRVRFIEYKHHRPDSEFDVSAIFPNIHVHFESEEQLNDYISKRLIDFCSGLGGREWERVK